MEGTLFAVNKSLTNAVASSRFIEAAIDAPPELDLKLANRNNSSN